MPLLRFKLSPLNLEVLDGRRGGVKEDIIGDRCGLEGAKVPNLTSLRPRDQCDG
jgi:hypothetical protein